MPENNNNQKLWFKSDYMEGAHPQIMKALCDTNLVHSAGYGEDPFCEEARELIKQACGLPQTEVYFLVGGTQTNAVVIDALLKSYQGVAAARSGHINAHESGAIEFGGHKVIPLNHSEGKVSAGDVRVCFKGYADDPSREHTVMPGMVYLSQPTEYGTLYSLDELRQIHAVCKEYNAYLYVDGARLAYALACPENNMILKDLAENCDAFYIGGTKCGAMFGEAVVFTRSGMVSHFTSIVKQHGALLAKGRILGIQFKELFSDDLYLKCGQNGIRCAEKLRSLFRESGYQLLNSSPTNQIFVIMEDKQIERLAQSVVFEFWERVDPDHSAVRFVTSWATTDEDIDALGLLLAER